MGSRSRSKRLVLLVIVAALAVATVVGACGNGGPDAPAGSGPAEPATTPGATDEPQGATDLAATAADPAPFGVAVAASADWTVSVAELVEAEAGGLLASVSGYPAPGHVFVALRYDLAYAGRLEHAADPFLPQLIDSRGEVYDTFRNTCVLRDEVTGHPVELDAGDRAGTAVCFEVPLDWADRGLVVVLQHFLAGGGMLHFAP